MSITDMINLVDMRTIFFSLIMINSCCTLFLLYLWKQSHLKYPGVVFWVANFAFQVAAQILISFRNLIPDWISIGLANTLGAVGIILGYMGLEYYFGKKPSLRSHILFFLCFTVLHGCFLFIWPDLAVRKFLIAFFWLVINVRGFRLMLGRREESITRYARPLVYVNALSALLNGARILELFIKRGGQQEVDYFQSGWLEKLGLIILLVLIVALAFSIFLSLDKRLNEEFKSQAEKYLKLFHESPNAIMLTSLKEGEILEVNKEFMTLLGYDDDKIIGRTTREIQFWKNPEERGKYVGLIKRDGRVRDFEVEFLKRDGEVMTGVFSADAITISGREIIITVISDISKRKVMEEKILDISNRDPLTQIFCRRYIFSRLDQALKDYLEQGKIFSVSIMDLDHFKRVNDRYGHQGGDAVLIGFTELVSSRIRASDIFGRFGGEEFILISMDTDKVQTREIINRILEAVRGSRVSYEGHGISYTFSCGISDCFDFAKEDLTVEGIIHRADSKLYEAKNNGRDQVML
ncbi:MAG TPA: diguanylate cyclase [Clostridiales bacterium]|nr:diguanylate cyclase [Clostridiales bacterium]